MKNRKELLERINRNGLDLYSYGHVIPDWGKHQVLITNAAYMPPEGGWRIPAIVNGEHTIFNSTPKDIVEMIVEVYALNGMKVEERYVWNYCNSIWDYRSPKRNMVRQQYSASIPFGFDLIPERELLEMLATPAEKLSKYIDRFVAVFAQEDWDNAVANITELCDPMQRAGGSPALHKALTDLKMRKPPQGLTTRPQVFEWLKELKSIAIDLQQQERLNNPAGIPL